MNKKIHILIIPSWYPQKSDDIGGSFFREQALALSKEGYKIGVISVSMHSLRNWKNITFKRYGKHFENDEGVLTYRQQSINFTPRINKIIKARQVAIGIKLFDEYVVCNGVPDIIHVHSLINAGYIAYKIHQKYGVPYIVTEHSSAFALGLVNRRRIKKLQPIVESSANNIAVSREFKKTLEKIFKAKKWQYIPNIVNGEFLESKLSFNNKDEGFKFINICLLSQNKRIDLLILAFAKAFKGNSNVKLKLGGDGPIRNVLKKLVESEGVSEQVTFLGALERKEVIQEIKKSDAFVLSSNYETFGVVVIEALALGKPVIATRCGGPESIIVPEVGYLVEKNSVESLAQAMNELYENKDRYSADDIRNYCRDNFSEKVVNNKLINVYTDILDGSA